VVVRTSSDSRILLEHVFSSLEKVVQQRRAARSSRPDDVDPPLFDALRSIDHTLRTFVAAERFWLELRSRWNENPQPTALQGIGPAERRNLHEVCIVLWGKNRPILSARAEFESILTWLDLKIRHQSPLDDHGAFHLIRPSLAYQSYIANLSFESFQQAHLKRRVSDAVRAEAVGALTSSATTLGMSASICGFAVDALSTAELLDRTQQMASSFGLRLDQVRARPDRLEPGEPVEPDGLTV
jgi:hypothetical protein